MISYQYFKQHWKRYAWSSFVTFGTSFIVSLALLIKELNFDSLMLSGVVGLFSALTRLIGKAFFEAIKELIVWIATKYQK